MIQINGKGKKEAFTLFGNMTETYLKDWLGQHSPNVNIGGINQWGITSMLRRLENKRALLVTPTLQGGHSLVSSKNKV